MFYIKNPKISKELILNHLNNKGLHCRPIWDLFTLYLILKNLKLTIFKAQKLFDRVILLL